MSFYISHFAKKLPREPEPQPLSVIGYVHDDISGDLEINKLVEKNERDKKIIELFNAQLLLPINQRSKALMKKFGIDVSKNGQIDAWPQSTAVKFHVNAYFPPDNTINDAARLVGTKSKILGLFTEQSTGNTYYFYFPLSMNGVTEDNVLKLDNFNTWIYRDTGEPVPDMGDEYNIYHALLDQLMNRNLNDSNAYLATLGMYSPEKGATFTLRNRNIRVESVVRNAGNAALNKIKLQSKETPAAGYGDDELNQMIPPIGEETLSTEKKLDNYNDYDFDSLIELLINKNNDVVEEPVVEEPVVEDISTGVGEGDKPIIGEPELFLPPEIDDETIEEITSTPDEVPKNKSKKKTSPPPEEEPEPQPPEEGKDGRFSIQEIVAIKIWKDKDPFALLAQRFPDYDVQFMVYGDSSLKQLKRFEYLIQKIDKDKKLIEVSVQENAFHSQQVDGYVTHAKNYKLYNSAFVLTGDKWKAVESLPTSGERKSFTSRISRFTDNKYTYFEL